MSKDVVQKNKTTFNFMLNSGNPDVVFLYETKKKRSVIRNFLSHFPNVFIVDPVGIAGELVMAWVNGFNFEIVHSSSNMINVLVKTNFSEKEWLLTGFYGSPYKPSKLDSWKCLEDIVVKVNYNKIAWMVIGDRNQILSKEDKQGEEHLLLKVKLNLSKGFLLDQLLRILATKDLISLEIIIERELKIPKKD